MSYSVKPNNIRSPHLVSFNIFSLSLLTIFNIGSWLQTQAMSLANKLNISNFKASNHWLANFKRRYHLSNVLITGESAKVDQQKIEDWLVEHQQKLMSYRPEDLYNCDETGLFYRLLPSRTLSVKGAKCHGGAASKERITILLCTNMSGTHKLTPLVIGKSRQPRCFPKLPRNQKHFSASAVGCHYRHHPKSWMDRSLFDEWLKNLQRMMAKDRRQILLLMDNFSGHHLTTALLPNIELLYLPANTTSLSQPLDQGIIQNCKVYYKRDLLNFYFAQLETDDPSVQIKPINLLQALRLVKTAWDSVKKETIVNCFRKALPSLFAGKIIETNLTLSNLKSNSEPLNSLSSPSKEELSYRHEITLAPSVATKLFSGSVTFDDYLHADSGLFIGDFDPSEDSETELEEDESSDEPMDEAAADSSESSDVEVNQAPLVTNKQACEAVALLLRHCNQTGSFGTSEVNACLTKHLNQLLMAKYNQSKSGDIRNYFSTINK